MAMLYTRIFVAYLVFSVFIILEQQIMSGQGGLLRGIIWGAVLGIPLAFACLDWISGFSAVAILVRLILALLIDCIYLGVILYFNSLGMCVFFIAMPLVTAAISNSIYSKNK